MVFQVIFRIPSDMVMVLGCFLVLSWSFIITAKSVLFWKNVIILLMRVTLGLFVFYTSLVDTTSY